jgi:predicted DNA-binding transcriptional regulator YafY
VAGERRERQTLPLSWNSERTIYRDVNDMVARGVPIDGAAGVGYILLPDFELPELPRKQLDLTRLCALADQPANP